MKKADIYKLALALVVKQVAADNDKMGVDPERTYAIIGEICEHIRIEVGIEAVRARNIKANAEYAAAAEDTNG